MVEHRKFSRLQKTAGSRSSVICSGLKEDVKVFDVSAGGMKVSFQRPVSVGEDIYGKISVVPEIGPFFVRGKVLRVVDRGGEWETAVQFEKVSTFPFLLMNMYQVA